MTNVLSSVGAALKAAASAASVQRLPFSRHYGGTSTYLPYGLTNLIHNTPASSSWEELAGDPLSNSIVARCVECIANALPDAPPFLECKQKSKDGGQDSGGLWTRVDEHPVLDLLRSPNPFHSDAELWGLVVAGERTRGRAFWYLAWDDTRPREIWPLQSERVTVLGSEEEFISGYRVQTESGRVLEVGEEQVIHFRHLVNPWNPREGWTPLETGKRQLAGDNAAASYHTSILRNSGVLSLLVAVKEGSAGGSVTPDQMESFVRALQRKLFGEGAGGIAGLNLPLDVHRMSYSPDEMALDRLISYYETRLCILMGVDPMVAGVGSGTQQKTYANFGEALNDFWERTVVPMHNRHAAVLTAQLLPLFGLEPCEWRLRFDYSQVAALQENKDGLHARIREDFRAGVIDLYTAQVERGLHEVPQEFKGRFYGDKPEELQKSSPESKHFELKYDPLQPRDEFGKWTIRGRFYAPLFDLDGGIFHGPDGGGSAPVNRSEVYRRVLPELRERAHKFLPEKAYVFDMDSGEEVHQSTASVDNSSEVSIDTSKHEGRNRIVVVHSHDRYSPPSADDWLLFFSNENVRVLVTVVKGTTYTFRKPDDWQFDDPDFRQKLQLLQFGSFYKRYILEEKAKLSLANKPNEELSDEQLYPAVEEASRRLAQAYGVDYVAEVH